MSLAETNRWATRIIERIGTPLDAWAVAATLEAEGFRDIDAQERAGKKDLFAFAEAVLAEVKRIDPHTPSARAVKSRAFLEELGHLVEASVFALPLIGQVACILLTGYSLWASVAFTPEQATVVGFGTLASFVLSGALVSAIGREGPVHGSQDEWWLLRTNVMRLYAIGLCVGAALIGFGILIEIVAPLLEPSLFIPALLYFIGLSALWTSLATLVTLRCRFWPLILTTFGGLLVSLLVRKCGMQVHAAQILAISLTAIAAFIIGARRMNALAKNDERSATLPPEALFFSMLPYAAYGFGYFAFLFTDRCLAWTAPRPQLPQPIWFQAPYELGMDWALVSLIGPMIFVEQTMRSFHFKLQRQQASLKLSEIRVYRRSVAKFVATRVTMLLCLSAASVLVTYGAGLRLIGNSTVPMLRDFLDSPITKYVFWPAAISYQLLTLGLLFVVMLFSLRQTWTVVDAILRAFAVSLVVGFCASRFGAPENAVYGLLAGSIVLAWRLLRAGRVLVARIDYFDYSAF